MAHKDQEKLEEELDSAAYAVRVGGVYYHYKNPDKHYRVISLAVQEATDKVCVIYQAMYDERLTFVRDLDVWLSEPEPGVARFSPSLANPRTSVRG